MKHLIDKVASSPHAGMDFAFALMIAMLALACLLAK